MREHKFRVWTGTQFLYSDKETGGFWGDIVLDDEELSKKQEQYTGLKDKNDKEIYEGDIVKGFYVFRDMYDALVKEPLKGVIVFENGGFRFTHDQNNFLDLGEDLDAENDLEVIGNIYENPELLDGKD